MTNPPPTTPTPQVPPAPRPQRSPLELFRALFALTANVMRSLINYIQTQPLPDLCRAVRQAADCLLRLACIEYTLRRHPERLTPEQLIPLRPWLRHLVMLSSRFIDFAQFIGACLCPVLRQLHPAAPAHPGQPLSLRPIPTQSPSPSPSPFNLQSAIYNP